MSYSIRSMRLLLRVLTIAVSALFAVPSGWATIVNYSAVLNGSNEAPQNLSPGIGFAMVTIDDVLHTMRIDMTFSGLLGNTTVAHIHCCTALPLTGTAGVATTTPNFLGFTSGLTSGSYLNTLDLTLASSFNPAFITTHGQTPAGAEAALLAGLSSGKAYFNVHTLQFPGGEIRGFLTQVPEPGSLALFGAALAGLAATQRRRKPA